MGTGHINFNNHWFFGGDPNLPNSCHQAQSKVNNITKRHYRYSIMSWISTYYHTVGAHPVRSAVGASLAAGAVTAIAAFRWVNRQVSGGNNPADGFIKTGIKILSGPAAALITGIHVYTLLAFGGIRLAMLLGGELLAVNFIPRDKSALGTTVAVFFFYGAICFFADRALRDLLARKRL
jgi:hypothetical protein